MSNLQDSVLFTPYRLGQVTLRNRTIRSAAFESMGKDFSPTQQLKDYHVSVARGGIGMTTLAYAALPQRALVQEPTLAAPGDRPGAARHHRRHPQGRRRRFDPDRSLR